VKVRQAVLMAVSQQDYLDAQIGDPEYYKVCPALFVCGTPLASDVGAPKKPDLEKAKQLLKEGGYDGKPIVVMQPTDLAIVAPLAPVSVQALRAIGMNIDMQSMDWQTLVSRRAKQDPPAQGGWNIFHTTWVNADMTNPIGNLGMNAKGKTGGWFGWADDAEIEKMRDAFARETDPAKQKQIAADIQKRAYDVVMYVPTGQYAQPYAFRKNVTGVMAGPVPVFWNMEKK
jgi:peptide/nickel transport system substrate-binding protein